MHIENLNFCVLFARMGKARPNNKWNIDLITEPVELLFLHLIYSESSLLFYSANAVFIVALFCAIIIIINIFGGCLCGELKLRKKNHHFTYSHELPLNKCLELTLKTVPCLILSLLPSQT